MSRTLGYWDIRGIGMPIRHMLAYLGVEYEDKLYTVTKPPHDKAEWRAVKYSLGFDFPNLPYWVDGDIKLTESRAILRHIARVHDSTSTLLPTDPTIAYKADMMENIIFEPMLGLARFANDFDSSKEQEMYTLFHEKLQGISKFLGNNEWIAGKNITFADFWLYETLIWFTMYQKDFLEPYANLQNLKIRFEELPAIKQYMGQHNYIKGPCISPLADKFFICIKYKVASDHTQKQQKFDSLNFENTDICFTGCCNVFDMLNKTAFSFLSCGFSATVT